jgi:hypothetical protein
MRGQEDLDQISKAITAIRVRGLIVVLDLVTIRAAPSIASRNREAHTRQTSVAKQVLSCRNLLKT